MTTTLVADVKRFLTFAQDLNKTVSRRVSQAAKLKEFVDMAVELGDKITQKIDLVLTANLVIREQFNTIYNACSVLNININKQKEVIGDIRILEAIDQKIEKRLMYTVLMLSESIQKALSLIQSIIEQSNGMILLDHRIIRYDALIGEQMKGFIEMMNRYQSMVGNDWRTYGVNEIKKDFTEEFIAQAIRVIETVDVNGLTTLLHELREELNFQKGLSDSIVSQVPFADEMNRIGKSLYYDPNSIRNMINSKYALHRENLEVIAQLSVILSLEIEGYLEIREILDPGQISGDASPESRRLFKDLNILFDIACGSIESLIELNHYTVEIFDTNAKREEHIVELSNMYLRCYDNIRKELDSAAKGLAPISDGIQKNIIIGQVLEKNLSKILDNITG